MATLLVITSQPIFHKADPSAAVLWSITAILLFIVVLVTMKPNIKKLFGKNKEAENDSHLPADDETFLLYNIAHHLRKGDTIEVSQRVVNIIFEALKSHHVNNIINLDHILVGLGLKYKQYLDGTREKDCYDCIVRLLKKKFANPDNNGIIMAWVSFEKYGPAGVWRSVRQDSILSHLDLPVEVPQRNQSAAEQLVTS